MNNSLPSSKNKGHMDIAVDVPEEFQTKCKICEQTFTSPNALAGHVGAKHRVKFEDYLVKYFLNNMRPVCPICSEKTRYVRGKYSFKKYCKSHANEARKEWSTNNMPFDPGWKKGLTKEDHPGIMSQSIKISGEGNPWHGKSLPPETLKKSIEARKKAFKISKEEYYSRVYDFFDKGFRVLTKYEDYEDSKTLLTVECQYRHIFQKTITNLKHYPNCPNCQKSVGQIEVEEFIKSLNVPFETNNRSIISPYELDIYLPDHNLAIEYNGLYWHSEKYKPNNYHAHKSELCENKNIKLFHIFSDEWREKKEIVKSMILHRINKTPNKVYARKCTVKEIPLAERKQFFEKNHISGDTNAKVSFGLYYNNKLISCISLRTSVHKKYKNGIEIARFATSLNTCVVGGLSKLLKKCVDYSKENDYNYIFTYADKRFALNQAYLKTNFKPLSDTILDYWYTDGEQRFNRFKFRARNNKSEKQIANEHEVFKVFGCGSKIYKFILNG